MSRTAKLLGLTLMMITASAAGDAVVFETDFSVEPEDWYNTGFTFGPEGAVFSLFSYGSFDLSLCTGGMPPVNTIFIPDGTDSVTVEIDHFLNISGGEYPSIQVKIQLGSTGHPLEEVFLVVLNQANPQIYQSYEHSFSPDWIQGGEHMAVHFRMDAISDDLGSSYEWKITRLKVTAHGEYLALPQRSWGAIKASL